MALYDDGEEELREIIDRSAITQEFLDRSDILFNMFHNRQRILGRSKKGAGTLTYRVDDKGVFFSLPLPETTDGEDALELVRSGVIDGCSFAFSTRYYDSDYVERKVERVGDKVVITCRVKVITGIYDMCITPNPAYSDTTVEARSLADGLEREEKKPEKKDLREYIAEMRSHTGMKL